MLFIMMHTLQANWKSAIGEINSIIPPLYNMAEYNYRTILYTPQATMTNGCGAPGFIKYAIKKILNIDNSECDCVNCAELLYINKR